MRAFYWMKRLTIQKLCTKISGFYCCVCFYQMKISALIELVVSGEFLRPQFERPWPGG